MTSAERDKINEKIRRRNEPILVESKVLEDFKCGNCGAPLSIHVYFRGDKYERIVECKVCEISFPLEGDQKAISEEYGPVKRNIQKKKDSGRKKESMVERLVKQW